MTRKLKALGLALVAVFAISAVAASAASATDMFTSPENTSVVTGNNTNPQVFTIAAPKVSFTCSTATFAGTVTGKSVASVTVFPTYKGTVAEPTNEKCEATIGNLKFDMNKCAYILTGETTGVDETKADATVSIDCPAGVEIEITGLLGCIISIPSQTPTSGGVIYTNGEEAVEGKKIKDVMITATSTGITYTTNAACQALAKFSAEANNATYNGSVTATGFKDEGAGTNYDEFKDSTVTDLEVSGS